MTLEHKEAFGLLEKSDNILVLTHRNPDGDAVGSAFALRSILKEMGKRVRVEIDTVPPSLSMPVTEEAFGDFEPDFVVTVDVADKKLLTDEHLEKYGDRVNLAIDHHESNKPFAENLLLDFRASAACEVIFDMLEEASFSVSEATATALYLGISTDTGCFRYPNCTAHTLYAASRLVEKGAPNAEINRIVFETKTRAYVQLEALAMSSMRTYFDGKCAVIVITQDMFGKTGTTEADVHGIAALPRQIEGVMAGIVIREKTDGTYKASVRTNEPLNAAGICGVFGGGGHRLAAGCDLTGTKGQVVNAILEAVEEALKEI
ncbi:MAG: bifunctional oligoribonuclease/PAP phosphatase NrnA [Clostridia bacterium]|nr:bifunctional oligoribonuclease/PAP phosphatase NrnA [Clostridia bacterium]